MNAEECVERGAMFLDEKKPGWENDIGLDWLRTASGCNCPLGQLYGGYFDAVEELGLGPWSAEQLGFLASGNRVKEMERVYAELDAAWRVQVIARRWKAGIAQFMKNVSDEELASVIEKVSA